MAISKIKNKRSLSINVKTTPKKEETFDFNYKCTKPNKTGLESLAKMSLESVNKIITKGISASLEYFEPQLKNTRKVTVKYRMPKELKDLVDKRIEEIKKELENNGLNSNDYDFSFQNLIDFGVEAIVEHNYSKISEFNKSSVVENNVNNESDEIDEDEKVSIDKNIKDDKDDKTEVNVTKLKEEKNNRLSMDEVLEKYSFDD